MRKALSVLYSLLTTRERKRGVYVILLITLQSILDFFSLAAFLPLIFFIVNPELINTNSFIKGLVPFQSTDNSLSFIVGFTIFILLFIIIKNIVSLSITRIKAKYAYDIGANLAMRALQSFTQKTYHDFTKSDFSKEVSRIANYPFAFSTHIILPAALFLSEILVCILILGGMMYYDYKILIFLTIVFIPVIAFYYARKNRLHYVRTMMKEQHPLVLKYALQLVEGLIEIRTYARERFFSAKFKKSNDLVAKAFVKDQVIQTSSTRLTEVIAAFIICILIVYAVLSQHNFQQTILLLSIYASASFRIIPSINRIMHSVLQYKTHEHLIYEFEKLSSEKSEVPEQEIPSVAFTQKIQLHDISIGYPGMPAVLHNIQLEILKGDKVAITGKSGEGKTTLLITLLGFLEPERGNVFVDGKKISSTLSLRSSIGYVSQNPFIIDGSLAENIAFGIPLEEMDREKILYLVNQLGLEEFVQTLPQNIDTTIGEKGIRISGGQRQRIAIARALYSDAEILLLDEVTNQVHTAMEIEIMNLLNNLSAQGKTIIIVTHKIHAQEFFDAIYHLDKGSIKKVTVSAQ